jgi:pimeloyl-ACP methyl ester carboxylesterase
MLEAAKATYVERFSPTPPSSSSATKGSCSRMRDRRVTIDDGTKVAYRVGGGDGGPDLVFVHGWCSNLTHWDQQLQHFASTHRVLAVDRRGHGRSDISSGGCTPVRHAHDLAAIVRKERLRDIVVVAHAGGGPTALVFADRNPHLVRGLVLIDSNISRRSKLGRPHSPERSALGRLVDQLSGPEARPRFEAIYRGFFSAHAGAIAETAVHDAMKVPLPVARADLAGLAADSESAARRCRRPVLWLTVEPADTVRLRSIFTDLRFGVVVGSGHFPHLEVPAQVNAMIERFLTEIADPAPAPAFE